MPLTPTEPMKQPTDSFAAFAARARPAASADGGGCASRPTGDTLAGMIDDAIDELDDDLTEELEQGARLSVAYRVARALAGAQGHIAFDDSLGAVPEAAWSAHTAAFTQGHAEGAAGWLRALAGLSVGLVPSEATATTFAEALWTVALRLGLPDGDDAGRLGVLSLLDSLESGDVESWPTTEAIVELEDALVLHALHLATVSPPTGDDTEAASTAKAERVLREEYGFTEAEVQSVMALARARALELLPTGDGARALQYASLEDGVRRAQHSMDLRSELSFRKLQAQVLGLTRGDGIENTAVEFMSVVKRVSARQDAELMEAPRSVEALPAANRRTEEVEPMVLEPAPEDDEFDSDALAEFDAENRPG